ncbi:uncharacterized mitochondrial protein AtMg00370-like [Nicotiana sylvestris]|uniref:uncharacterized mitochondrial protein AtMg00370-like n=1 Tax=Nicotiana sylvestris TaxID=4096 RepID=UPI00388CE271
MIFQSFLLGNLVSLCMKIINSVVVVGLYYGFLTTFSIGPSYLFLLRALVMEEGTEKKVSATTGFITGQLMMFISIYYAPLHLALGRPHTITVLALPYLLFHFFWNNHKHFFDYGSTTRNSMRNLSIQCVFLNNLIFQLFNHFILPSSMLARLVNIYLFRCNSKILFVTRKMSTIENEPFTVHEEILLELHMWWNDLGEVSRKTMIKALGGLVGVRKIKPRKDIIEALIPFGTQHIMYSILLILN